MGAEEALEDLLLQLRRDARPVVLDRQHDVAVGALDRRLDGRARGRCGAARSPSGSARAGATRPARRRSRRPRSRRSRSRGRRPPARARRRPRRRRRRGRSTRRGGSRPASARASSSRSATSRRIRRLERSAEAAASRCSPCSVSSSSSRFASTDVSGVRSSCEASATNSRWRSSAASVSVRASSSACSIDSSVVASSATSSSASGRGIVSDGLRVRSISRAASVSSAIGSIARRAVARPASSASAAPPSTPRPRNSFTRLTVDADVGDRGARTGPRTCSTVPSVGPLEAQLARLDLPAVDLLAATRRGCPSRARRRSRRSTCRRASIDADRRVVAGGVGVEVDAASRTAGCRRRRARVRVVRAGPAAGRPPTTPGG